MITSASKKDLPHITALKIEVMHVLHQRPVLHKKIGLLVNFRHQKVEIKRIVLNLPEKNAGDGSAMSADS